VLDGGAVNTEKWVAIDADKGCIEDEEKKCAGYSIKGFTSVVNNPKTGNIEMLVDATLSWAGTEKSWD
jgi:hypothetical protein